MTNKYDLYKDYGFSGNDMASLNPYAVMCFFRYKYPATFSRESMDSFTGYITTAQELRDDKPFVVINDIAQVSVTTTKGSHVSSMSASLFPSRNYLSKILPGDYVFVWMVQDKGTAERLLKNLKSGEACNGFMDGLKFFGKVAALTKDLVQAPNGTRSAIYTMTAAGFTELDASVYYEPYLALNSVGLATDFLRDIGVKLNSIIADNGQGIAINKIIPVLLTSFYGKGIPKNRSVTNSTLNTTSGLDNPNGFVIPTLVGKIFGVAEGTKPNGLIGFTDLLEVVHGVQAYDPSAAQESYSEDQDSFNKANAALAAEGWSPTDNTAKRDYQDATKIFMPFPLENNGEMPRIRSTCTDQLGIFLPQLPHFNGQKTVWSILTQFLNPSVNEIYTTLRVNPEGKVFPTLVTRQLPFSSSIIKNAYTPRDPVTGSRVSSANAPAGSVVPDRNIALTRFLDLPRWVIDPVLLKKIRIGRSDALRFNFISVQGESGQPTDNRTAQLVRDPPVIDPLDIARSGLRPYMTTVNCAPADIINRRAGEWMYILSDILMGQHMTLTGTLETHGIVHPICPGDNIELDSAVFHIESVTHTFAMSGSNKTFITNMTLSHGMSDRDNDGAKAINVEDIEIDGFMSKNQGTDLHIYAGVAELDQTSLNAPVMGDSEIKDDE